MYDHLEKNARDKHKMFVFWLVSSGHVTKSRHSDIVIVYYRLTKKQISIVTVCCYKLRCMYFCFQNL